MMMVKPLLKDHLTRLSNPSLICKPTPRQSPVCVVTKGGMMYDETSSLHRQTVTGQSVVSPRLLPCRLTHKVCHSPRGKMNIEKHWFSPYLQATIDNYIVIIRSWFSFLLPDLPVLFHSPAGHSHLISATTFTCVPSPDLYPLFPLSARLSFAAC